MLSGMRRNGRIFQEEVTERLRDRGIPVVPREPRWADRSVEANVLELGSSVEIAELPDDVIMVSSLQGGQWRLKDVFFDLDEAIDVAGDLYRSEERRAFAQNRARGTTPGRSSFATRATEAQRARPRQRARNAGRSHEDLVLEAVKRAPIKGASGRRLIADVWDDTNLPLEDLQAALIELQQQGKVILMRDDTAHMVKRGEEAREAKRELAAEIQVGGNPRHLVFLESESGTREPRPRPRPKPKADAPRAREVVSRSREDLVLEAVRRAPVKSDTGRRLIADVWDDTNLPLAELQEALLNLQRQGKLFLMRDDAVHMFKRGEEARQAEREIAAEIQVAGFPRHLVFLKEDGTHHRNPGPVVKRDVEKSVGPSHSHKQRVTVRAGLRVVPITEGSTRGKFFLDEFPEADFPRRSTLRHDAEHYGVVLEPYEVEA
jgi:thioredoxin-related protein